LEDKNIEEKKQNNILEKIDKQIENIEQRMNSLLEDIDIKTLTPAERIDFAIKFMTQYARFLALRKTSELAEPEGREKELLRIWMKQMRGEIVE